MSDPQATRSPQRHNMHTRLLMARTCITPRRACSPRAERSLSSDTDARENPS